MEKITRKDIVFIVVSVGISLLIYSSVFGGFFQQDEWLGYGRYILLRGSTPLEFIKYAFAPGVGHYTPLTPLLVYLSFSFFGLNYHFHVLISLLMHAFTIFLFYIFSKFFFQKQYAFYATLLFGLTASSFQATAWVVANIATHMSSIFGLLSLIFIAKFITTSPKTRTFSSSSVGGVRFQNFTNANNEALESLKIQDKHRFSSLRKLIKAKKERFFFFSITALIISLLFKELTLGLFLLLPLAIIFWGNSFNKKQKIQYSSIILIVGVIYLFFRVFILFVSSGQLSSEYPQGNSNLIYNFITVPMKSVSQTFVPVNILKQLSYQTAYLFDQKFEGNYKTPEFDVFVVRKILEAVSILLTLIFVFAAMKITKSNANKKIVVFGIIFMLVNSAVIAWSPEKGGIISAIDSRNLYFISAGSAILIIFLLKSSLKKFFIYAFILLLMFNVYFLSHFLSDLNLNGKIRQSILDKIQTEYPSLYSKVIFYTESDTSFYGLPENERILPFQSGFGQTLLAWYYPTEKWPKGFFDKRFLWDITAQGYKEIDGRGFGYFRDFNLMVNSLKSNHLNLDSVIAFQYSGEDNRLKDVTAQVHGQINGYFASKKKLLASMFSVTSQFNATDIPLLTDGDRTTFWNGLVPYVNSQFLNISLKVPTKIAEIVIDSYNNKDQDSVGYRVSISNDGETWREVFSSKLYPPGADGLVKLYFEPQMVKYIRLEQIGQHKYASWEVNELNIYEATD